MKHYFVFVFSFIQVACVTMSNASPLDSMHKYVESLQDTCVYDDGYACAEPSDTQFYQQTINKQLIDARYLQAWPAAYEKFDGLAELTKKQKDLRHYKIGFAEDSEHYIVYFGALLMPYIEDGKPVGVSRNTYGKSVKIWVKKSDKSVNKYLFLK